MAESWIFIVFDVLECVTFHVMATPVPGLLAFSFMAKKILSMNIASPKVRLPPLFVMFRFLLFVFLFQTCPAVYQTFNCNGTDLVFSVKSGELVFFQSDSFPQNIPVIDGSACSATFKRADNLPKGLYFAFTNGFLNGFGIADENGGGLFFSYYDSTRSSADAVYYDSTRSSADAVSFFAVGATQLTLLSSMLGGNYSTPWQAFQAIVFAPSDSIKSTNCWLQKQVFTLTDPNQIIPIISEDASQVKEFCQWFFTIPAGFQLKVNCFHWSMFGGEYFRVKTNLGETYDFGNDFSKTFRGTNFTISYNRTIHPNSGNGIVAFISLLSVAAPTTSDCIKTTTNASIITYSNFDPQFGYKPNMQCSKPLKTVGGQVYDLTFTTKFIERAGETIKLIINNGNISPYFISDGSCPYFISDGSWYTLEPTTSMYITDVAFSSDGSVNQAGFSFNFNPKNCDCAKSTMMAYCNGTVILGVAGEGHSNYCSNMDCTFVIVPNLACPDALIFFETKFNPRIYINDTLTVYLDRNVITSINTAKDYKMVVEPGQNLTLSFKTGQVSNIVFDSWIVFYLSTYPYMVTRTLTDESPTFAVNLGTTGSVVVKVDLKSIDLLELFVVQASNAPFDLSNIQIYDGSTYMKPL
uniref:CUB domain-containing protein n=1 Tax=Panagrolaimus sp. JU765 TaxID=591449 RepID=A0AC34R6Q6_9BILA